MRHFSTKKVVVLFLITILTFTLSACSASTSKKQSTETLPNQQSTVSNEQSTQNVITDREGNTFTIPEKMDKIISMAPSITETLIDLGLGDKIIATDKYSVGIEGLTEGLPTYDIMAPDTESITALKPDVIFATGMSRAKGDDPFKPVTDLGVTMTYIPSSTSIQGIKDDIIFLGKVTGTEEKAESIVSDLEKAITDITDKMGDKKSGKTVFFEIAAAPDMYSFGKGTFLNEIIELLGAENILADQESWVSVSEEVVLQKNPDVIFTNVDYIEDPIADVLNRNGWDVINAVKNKEVYQIDKNSSSHPNEFVVKAISEMAKALYPDLF